MEITILIGKDYYEKTFVVYKRKMNVSGGDILKIVCYVSSEGIYKEVLVLGTLHDWLPKGWEFSDYPTVHAIFRDLRKKVRFISTDIYEEDNLL